MAHSTSVAGRQSSYLMTMSSYCRRTSPTPTSSDKPTRHQVPNMKTTTTKTKQTSGRLLSPASVICFLLIVLVVFLNQESPLTTSARLVEASTLPIDALPNSTTTTTTTISTSTANSQIQLNKQRQQVQASFSTPNQAINITHVTYDPLYDTVYLGATNTIYQLNGTDLSVQHEQSTGPLLDNPSCGISECHGFEDYMKPTQDVNKLLVIDYQHKKLLSCGSTKQGACRRFQLNNIAHREDLIPMAVAANDDNSSTYAFIAPARYTYEPATSLTPIPTSANNSPQQQQQVLYVASTYTKVGQSRELLVPAIGTRTLDDGPNLLKLYENSFLDSARIDINSHLRDYFLVNYLYGFASSNYIYFVTVQKKATSRDFEELGYHTRLARICITDSSYNSYTEVDLKCVPNKRKGQLNQQQHQKQKHSNYFSGQEQQQQQQQQQQHQQNSDQPNDYPLLQDAILVDAGSQLLQSLAQSDQLPGNFFSSGVPGSSPDDNKVLLGVFSSAKDHTQYAGDHSALCAFSLAQIEEKFNDNIHNCYTGKMQSRNMEYIAGNVQECPKNGQGGNVVNFCHETLKINGTIPIVSEASIHFYNTTLTAITATNHVNTQAKSIISEQVSAIEPGAAGATHHNGPRQHTVVFAGTSNGHIKKILLNNASNGIEFEDFQLDTQTILSDLHLHSSGNQLIAATPYKVFKVATHNCAQYSSCRECSQSRNPYCGWCLLKKSCTTRSECVPSMGFTADQKAASNAIAFEPAAAAANKQLQQPKWISSDSSGKCIDLQSIVPDKIPMTSTGKVDLYIDRLPRLPKEHSYRCVFNRSEQTSATMAPFGLSCPLPKLMERQRHIQIEPGRDHAVVELAVRSSETNTDFLDGKITFFDCQRHTTCKDCLTTNWGCNWCLNENVCLFNTSKCEKSASHGQQQQDNSLVQLLSSSSSSQQVRNRQQSAQSSSSSGAFLVVGSSSSAAGPTPSLPNGGQRGSTLIASGPNSLMATARNSNTISQMQQCPTFDVGHRQDIMIADGSERELSIRVKNMPQFKGAVKCIVEIENYEISLKAQIQDDRVICENSTYSYAADVGLLNGQLKVIYSDNNIFIDRTNFTLYKCHLLGAYLNRPDCSLCQRIDSRFQCSWCGGSCQHRPTRCLGNERPDDTCPPPRIDFVHPLSGPAQGGTRVTIEGSNLGQSFEEIAGRVSIGNVPCKPLEEEYRPSNRIVCLTSPVVGRLGTSNPSFDSLLGDVMVGNKAGYTMSPQKFAFKALYLRDHQPRFGPQSGGTRVVLSGLNMNIGSNTQVFLDELPCLVEAQASSGEQLVCRTTSSRQASRAIRRLKLIIDDLQIVRDEDVFYYTSDPIIHKITPLRAYLSGGRPINVFGANLTVVQAPRMAIHDSVTGKKINESLCILQDDTRMQCPSPAVNLQLMDLEFAEQQQLSPYDPSSNNAVNQAAFSSATWTANGPGKQQQQPMMFQQDESVKFKLSFIMDNVQQTSHPQLQTEIAYTSDPKMYPFASVQYKTLQEADQLASIASSPSGHSNLQQQQQQAEQQTYQIEPDTFLLQPGEPTLVLYGEHLRAAVSEYEITVTVGQDLCNLTQLAPTRLVCVMPLDHMATPTDEEGHQTQRALPLVVVRIGFNLRYELGFVQYHPMLVEQIVALVANLTAANPASSTYGNRAASSSSLNGQHLATGPMKRLMHPTYPQYMPRESESMLQRVSNFLASFLMLVGYLILAVLALGLVYSGVHHGLELKEGKLKGRNYKKQLARVESLERSLRQECRVGSLALQGDLNELIRHMDLSGVPLLHPKLYIMKVFFPGMNNHPLLLRGAHSALLQDQQQHSLGGGAGTKQNDLPMAHFEQLVLTKPFLISFINTLERQPNFTIRDKVNVASLLMIVLMGRLDYATDIMKTLLYQLVERSVRRQPDEDDSASQDGHLLQDDDELAGHHDEEHDEASAMARTTRRLTRRASNLLSGLPISKRSTPTRLAANQLGKVVSGSASSLMASTSVAAQMLLARVGHKTSPLSGGSNYHYQQQPPVSSSLIGSLSPHDCNTLGLNQADAHCPSSIYMSTTTFNNLNSLQQQQNTSRRLYTSNGSRRSNASSRTSTNRKPKTSRRQSAGRRTRQQAQLMLRRTDSIVEKMLTNWLALNMYDHFQGQVGSSLYLLFEALKCQLERGPVDAITGDAYYSLNEHKLLREPNLHFEVVNLYVIADASILHVDLHPSLQAGGNLLLDNNNSQSDASQLLYDQRNRLTPANTNNRFSQQSFASSVGNTITLALRVLDCDTINQVKGKILSALYRNSAYSCRLSASDVELSLRQHQPLAGHQTLAVGQQQYVTIALQDEDFSSMNSTYGGVSMGSRRLNTLRHYGVTDQAIMMLKRTSQSRQMNSANMEANDHYSNPYTEIQYGRCQQQLDNTQQAQQPSGAPVNQPARHQNAAARMQQWHLIRSDVDRSSAHLSEHSNDSSSSPSSHSPSMMLLGCQQHNQNAARNNNNNLQQQFYHPSTSSTSSGGNVMDTNSTSANSSSMVVNNLMLLQMRQHHTLGAAAAAATRPSMMLAPQDQLQQPIYCQIGSVSAKSQQQSQYYCHMGQQQQQQQQQHHQMAQSSHHLDQLNYSASSLRSSANAAARAARQQEQENELYLARMLTSKGTIQKYLDDFFKTILTAKSSETNGQLYDEMAPVMFNGDNNLTTSRRKQQNSGACPPAVKWIFDLLDEAATKNGISDQSVIHAWKSNAFLLRFWVNFIKNPNYILDVEKSNTLDASLSVIAQTLMDSCAPGNQKLSATNEGDNNRLIFSKDLPKYKEMVRHFYQDIASMRPVSDQEMVKQMSRLSMNSTIGGAGKFDTNLALKELCVYAVNYGVELMNSLNADYACQQLELSQQLEQCFRSFTIFEAYR